MFLKIMICGLFFAQIIDSVTSAKILGLFAYTGKSHFLVFQPTLQELARRGHHITVVSYFEQNTTTKNYTGIPIPPAAGTIETTSFLSMEKFDGHVFTVSDGIEQLYVLTSVYENALSSKDVQSLINEKYDVILTELFNSDVMFGLIYKIGAPIIGLSSCDLMPWHNDAISNTNNPSYNPVLLSNLSPYMNLEERLLNTIYLLYCRFKYYYTFKPEAQELAEKYFGRLPDLSEIAANTSLILANTHFSVFGAKPVVPSIIEVAGVHMLPVKPLSKVLQETISKYEGVLYFSMGSVLDSGSMNSEKRNMFNNVFSDLKQVVLWKTSLNVDKKSTNILSSDWYPQRDILAHPKTVLFISHCGLLGTLEAIQSGVPILCIPMFGDQPHNARAVANIGVGLILQYNDITEHTLRVAINALLHDPKYRENSKRIAKAFNDRPLSPMDTSIYWIEYVIRHQGAPHIRSIIHHLTWYQYYNLDIIVIYLCILYVSYKILKFVIKLCLKLMCFLLKCMLPGSGKKVKTS